MGFFIFLWLKRIALSYIMMLSPVNHRKPFGTDPFGMVMSGNDVEHDVEHHLMRKKKHSRFFLHLCWKRTGCGPARSLIVWFAIPVSPPPRSQRKQGSPKLPLSEQLTQCEKPVSSRVKAVTAAASGLFICNNCCDTAERFLDYYRRRDLYEICRLQRNAIYKGRRMVIRHKPTNNCRQTVVRRLQKEHEIDTWKLSQSTTHFPFRAEPSRCIFPSFLNVSSAILTCVFDNPVFSTIAVREIDGLSCSNTNIASARWIISWCFFISGCFLGCFSGCFSCFPAVFMSLSVPFYISN